jgi:hypothetical protein
VTDLPDDQRCTVTWRFVAGDVRCLLARGHKGRKCRFKLGSIEMDDPRVADPTPHVHDTGAKHAVYHGKEPPK